MSRRIGNFKDPKTGEIHYLDTPTVSNHSLPPGRIVVLEKKGYTNIDYALASNEGDKTIELTASLKLDDTTTVTSNKIPMDEMRFAELLFDTYINDQTFAIREEVVEYMKLAEPSLALAALRENFIVDGLSLTGGYGAIYYDTDLVGVYEDLDISVENGSSQCTVTLDKVVSHTTLLSEKNPKIEYTLGNIKLVVSGIEILESQEGLLKKYVLKAAQTEKQSGTMLSPVFEHQCAEDLTPESPYFAERYAVLASAEIEDDNMEELFEDIFSL